MERVTIRNIKVGLRVKGESEGFRGKVVWLSEDRKVANVERDDGYNGGGRNGTWIVSTGADDFTFGDDGASGVLVLLVPESNCRCPKCKREKVAAEGNVCEVCSTF